MAPRRLLLTLAGIAIVVSAARRPSRADTGAPPGAATRPNIVYILADDLGFGDVGFNNPASKIPTPRMDSLASDGMRFTDAHSGSAVCTPTRYGILTGRYAWRGRLKKGVLNGYDPPLIEPKRMTVASMLRGQRYATACIGKWHLGLGWDKQAGQVDLSGSASVSGGPGAAGFDYSYIFPASLDMDPYVYLENGKVTEAATEKIAASPRPAFWRAGPIAPSFKHETCLATFTAKAEAWLDQRGKEQENPFFLYLALPSPHTPHVPRAEFRGKSEAGVYGDFVVETDWSVGRIIDALKRNGMAENTLVILTSDNGCHSEPLDLERKYGHVSNGIYRGQKSDAWDGGHRVPFAARWPGVVKPGAACDQTICLTDLLATCAGIAQVDLPADAGEDSYNLLPLLKGEAAGAEAQLRVATIHHSINGDFAVRRGEWKLVMCRGSGGWSLKEKDAPPGAPPGQLFNMKDDPGEKQNLYEKRPDVVAELTGLLQKYKRVGRSAPLH